MMRPRAWKSGCLMLLLLTCVGGGIVWAHAVRVIYLAQTAVPPTSSLVCSSFARVGSITLATGEQSFADAEIDVTNGFVYFISATTPIHVVKVDLASFTRVGAINLTLNTATSAEIDTTNGFLYVIDFGTFTAAKINLSTFTQVATLTIDVNVIQSTVIDVPNQIMLTGTNTSPARIRGVNLATFSNGGAVLTAAGQGNLLAAAIDQPAGFAYFLSNTTPVNINKVAVALTPSISSVLTMNAGEGPTGSSSAVIDPDRTFLYFGLTSANPGKIMKVRLSDFTRVGALTFGTGLGGFPVFPIPNNGFMYAATNTSPIQVKKINLSTFTETATITLDTNENFDGGDSNLMDTINGFLYVPTSQTPAHIVKIGC